MGTPTPCQQQAWPAIGAGRHALVAAPTGSGKTLAAFLGAIDRLVRLGLDEQLEERTYVLYVSPLKALSNDVHKNLEGPIEGINRRLAERLQGSAAIRSMVRTGDTPAAARQAMRRCPPHILVTTPESLFILLASDGGRAMLSRVETVIVDEVHALVGNKRGAHLSLSLARLDDLVGVPPVRIGLSATQKPIAEVARFLVGAGNCLADGSADCTIVDSGHARQRDLAIEMPESPLEALMSGEIWGEIYDRLEVLIETHRSTLVFVNTRRMAERVARALTERLGEEHVTSHHGSMARAQRLQAEQRLKSGTLKALVATASLELGIDVGDVDLVCQLGSPHAISLLLQRVGRSGHAVSGTPKGRLFPLSRDDLVECVALLDAVRNGELDTLRVPQAPLDVLAQQVTAACINRVFDEADLLRLVRSAWPYRDLDAEQFGALLRMLAEGFATRRGRRGSYLLRDAVNNRVRARRGARLTVVTNGGAIPDNADYDVVQEPEGTFVGTVNEDFAIESMPGDIFQLGNTSWRVLRIEGGRVRVADAHGQPPTIPFWFGEAPGRSDELSLAVSRVRQTLDRLLAPLDGEEAALGWLGELGVTEAAAQQLVDYLAAARAALGVLPSHQTLVLERFFDEAGGMQLVLHSPRGSRINRAFGLALRKRFCRSFNFELQAAASEDAIVLSLGETHSFELSDVARFLHPASAREVLVQALLDAPVFTTRWRWNANISLAVPRFRGGRKVPPHIQRMQAEDLVSVVFPDQLACLENITGNREIPDHPLVRQTIHDCLTEAMDIDGLERLLEDLHAGRVEVVARDLTGPSPLAQEILTAKPYAFLDDAPAEERRTRAVIARRWLDPRTAADLGRLEPAAVQRVREEAWPSWSDMHELHDALLLIGCMTVEEADGAEPMLQTLAGAGRAVRVRPPGLPPLWCATERWPELQALLPGVAPLPLPVVPPEFRREWSREEALVEMLRARLSALGPCTAGELGAPLGIDVEAVAAALLALEAEGFVLRGSFTAGERSEWCERRLLARIHRYTMEGLRREIQPVTAAELLRFLCDWQRLSVSTRVRGSEGLLATLEQMDGFEAPAAAWESSLLPSRVADYEPGWLDNLCLSGRVLWMRLSQPAPGAAPAAPLRSTPIAMVGRPARHLWLALAPDHAGSVEQPVDTTNARVLATLSEKGACFPDEIIAATGLSPAEIAGALSELAATGRVSADGFGALRALLVRNRRDRALDHGGRWSVLPRGSQAGDTAGMLEHVARALLARYGVVFRALLAREASAPPWRDLLRVLRRLEARGEIRGGRFVEGFAGEQYALPEAVGSLREVRRRPASGELLTISGADPLNLTGIITPGARVPALAGVRLVLRDGLPVATSNGNGEVQMLARLEATAAFDARAALAAPVPPGAGTLQ